jgi:hypothetical protein
VRDPSVGLTWLTGDGAGGRPLPLVGGAQLQTGLKHQFIVDSMLDRSLPRPTLPLLLRHSSAAAPAGEAVAGAPPLPSAAAMPSWNDGESSNESSVRDVSAFSSLIARVRVCQI